MIKVPEGFYLITGSAGFKYQNRDDVLFILSKVPSVVKGVFTKNSVKAAPVKIAMDLLSKKEMFRGILVNVGQANACTGKYGMDVCLKSLDLVGEKFGLNKDEIIPASTGVIGEIPDIELFKSVLDELYKNRHQKDPIRAARSIMTTDTFPKVYFEEIKNDDKTSYFLCIAKGAGMISPDMATMLCFILTDASVDGNSLSRALKYSVDRSFNLITVDGDTSTNDCVIVMANGLSEVVLEEEELKKILLRCCKELAYLIVRDGEGSTKVLTVKVKGSKSYEEAKSVALSVANSLLVKTAFFGEDPNWGRIVAAVGKSGVGVKEDNLVIKIGDLIVWDRGYPLTYLDELAKPIMKNSEIKVTIDLGMGNAECEILTCDLGYEYVRINAEYRT